MKKILIFFFCLFSIVAFSQSLKDAFSNYLLNGDYIKLNRYPTIVMRTNLSYLEKKDLDFHQLKKEITEIYPETLKNFKDNFSNISNKDYLNFDVIHFNLIDKKKCKTDFWKCFYKKYPNSNGLIEISNFGIYENQAFVYVGIQNSCLSGYGYYVFYLKENNVWIYKKTVSIWSI